MIGRANHLGFGAGSAEHAKPPSGWAVRVGYAEGAMQVGYCGGLTASVRDWTVGVRFRTNFILEED